MWNRAVVLFMNIYFRVVDEDGDMVVWGLRGFAQRRRVRLGFPGISFGGIITYLS